MCLYLYCCTGCLCLQSVHSGWRAAFFCCHWKTSPPFTCLAVGPTKVTPNAGIIRNHFSDAHIHFFSLSVSQCHQTRRSSYRLSSCFTEYVSYSESMNCRKYKHACVWIHGTGMILSHEHRLEFWAGLQRDCLWSPTSVRLQSQWRSSTFIQIS